MKKSAFVILLIGSLLTGSISVYAHAGKAKKAKTRHVSMAEQQYAIGSIISVAASEYDAEKMVSINIKLTDQNRIQVLEINTEDQELEKLLIKALQGRKINGNNETVSLVMTLKIVPEKENHFVLY
ncbi:MAG: hypothetical protein MUF42_08105 [Cytophagaceae bacterium]|nr:hypothetical protein [Cytophagaceae bacterium]